MSKRRRFWLLLGAALLAAGELLWLTWYNPETPLPQPLSDGASPQEKKPRLQAVRELDLPSFSRTVTVYHSKGYEKRAQELCDLLEEAKRFYEQKLDIQAHFSLAVLTRADWERVEKDIPFGLPSVSPAPAVVLLPATHDGVVVKDTLALRGKASAATLEKLEKAGFTFEQGAEKLCDLIGLHELGHVLTLAYGIQPPGRWANEFLATYFAHAYLQETNPQLATVFLAMSHDLYCVDGDRPQFTALEDFDRLYSGVGSANYGWYQGAFHGRVQQVYAVRKLAFLAEVRATFPAGTKEGEPARVVLERLERICPGFVAWGEQLR